MRNELDVEAENKLYDKMRSFWQPVAYSADVADTPVRVVLFGEEIVVARLGGEVRAFADLCRHRGARLSQGAIEGECLRCPYHGWLYDAEGSVVEIPANPDLSGRLQGILPVYRATESAGLVWLCMNDEPAAPVPDVPELRDDSFSTFPMDVYEWDTAVPRRVENYFDFSHFAWVHDGILGDRNHPEIGQFATTRYGGEIRVDVGPFLEYTNNPKNAMMSGDADTYEAWKRYRIFVPNAVALSSTAGPDATFVLFMACAPVARKRTRSFTFVARNYDSDKADTEYKAMQEMIVAQDKPIVEGQRPEELPEDLAAEMYVKGADDAALDYRRWVLDIVKDQFELAPTA